MCDSIESLWIWLKVPVKFYLRWRWRRRYVRKRDSETYWRLVLLPCRIACTRRSGRSIYGDSCWLPSSIAPTDELRWSYSYIAMILRIGIPIRELNIVHFFIVLLDPEIELLTVYQELREVKELWDKFPHVWHLWRSVPETIPDRCKKPIWDIKLASL